MELFLQELDSIKRVDSKVKFRFGNGAHLTSERRILLPLISGEDQKRLWLTIEVAPGSTPFLFPRELSNCWVEPWTLVQTPAFCIV